jgi:hypothetical protein
MHCELIAQRLPCPSDKMLRFSRYLNSSFGWDPMSKERELFNPLSRFVVVRPVCNANECEGIVAYAMFAFEREDQADVIYW